MEVHFRGSPLLWQGAVSQFALQDLHLYDVSEYSGRADREVGPYQDPIIHA